MMRTNRISQRLNPFLALSFLVAAVLACSGGGKNSEVDKANKLVDEGNAAVQEAKKHVTEAEDKKSQMLKTPVSQLAQARVLATESVAAYDRAKQKCKEAAQKYDEASRLKINEKFRDYLILKSKEFNKRAEVVDTAKDTPQAVIESTNRSSFVIRANANNQKVAQLVKEADDFASQADKLQKDNPNIFKS
jgi:hypothetical protein